MYQYTLVISSEKPLNIDLLDTLNINWHHVTVNKAFNGGDYTGLQGYILENLECMIDNNHLTNIMELLHMDQESFNKFVTRNKFNLAERLANDKGLYNVLLICTKTEILKFAEKV